MWKYLAVAVFILLSAVDQTYDVVEGHEEGWWECLVLGAL
jgi:hypothetical protein